LSEAGEFRTRPDVAIVVFGENPYAEGAGDVPSLEYSPGNKRDVAAAAPPARRGCAGGRRVALRAPAVGQRRAQLRRQLRGGLAPGAEGEGVADVLFRAPDGSVRYDFRGRLPFSWPRSARVPAVDRRPGEPPLFPYGYGLTYEDDGDPSAAALIPRTRAHRHPGEIGVRYRAEVEIAGGCGHAGSAWAIGIGGCVSPFLVLWKRTGLMRATT